MSAALDDKALEGRPMPFPILACLFRHIDLDGWRMEDVWQER